MTEFNSEDGADIDDTREVLEYGLAFNKAAQDIYDEPERKIVGITVVVPAGDDKSIRFMARTWDEKYHLVVEMMLNSGRLILHELPKGLLQGDDTYITLDDTMSSLSRSVQNAEDLIQGIKDHPKQTLLPGKVFIVLSGDGNQLSVGCQGYKNYSMFRFTSGFKLHRDSAMSSGKFDLNEEGALNYSWS